jgi:tetratricopeptide (TPR) repeat protein
MTLYHSSVLLRVAENQMRQGNANQAIETLKQALGQDPNLAEGHALLALCLLSIKRLHAAAHEAGISLTLEPELPLAHHAVGSVKMAQRRFVEAERAFKALLDLEPESAQNHRAMANLLFLTRRPDEADRFLQRALEMDPGNPDIFADMGDRCLARGDVDGAERWARQVLEQQPEHLDGLVLMGSVALRRGDVSTAREHALWALRINPQDHGALHLLTAIKSRSNWFLGLWWRYNTWMGRLGMSRAIVVLLVAFIFYRVATIATNQAGHPEVAALVQARKSCRRSRSGRSSEPTSPDTVRTDSDACSRSTPLAHRSRRA